MVGEASGGRAQAEHQLKSRKGFGYRARQARARPSNTSIRDLLSDDQFTKAVLVFPGAARVGEAKEGAIVNNRGRMGVPIGLRSGTGFLFPVLGLSLVLS